VLCSVFKKVLIDMSNLPSFGGTFFFRYPTPEQLETIKTCIASHRAGNSDSHVHMGTLMHDPQPRTPNYAFPIMSTHDGQNSFKSGNHDETLVYKLHEIKQPYELYEEPPSDVFRKYRHEPGDSL
jgi:hypothetical protein